MAWVYRTLVGNKPVVFRYMSPSPDPCTSQLDWQKKFQFRFSRPMGKRYSLEGRHLPVLKTRELETTG